MRKHKQQELVLKTNIMRESGWLYFIDKDGDLSKGRMGGNTQKKLFKTNIQREEGYLYFCKEGEENLLEIWRTKMDRK